MCSEANRRVQLPAVPSLESFCSMAQAGPSAVVLVPQHLHTHTCAHTHVPVHTHMQTPQLSPLTFVRHQLQYYFLQRTQQLPAPSTVSVAPSSASPPPHSHPSLHFSGDTAVTCFLERLLTRCGLCTSAPSVVPQPNSTLLRTTELVSAEGEEFP